MLVILGFCTFIGTKNILPNVYLYWYSQIRTWNMVTKPFECRCIEWRKNASFKQTMQYVKKDRPWSHCKSFLRRQTQWYLHSLHKINLPSYISKFTSMYYMKLPVYIDFPLYICVYTWKWKKKKRHFLHSKVYLLFV